MSMSLRLLFCALFLAACRSTPAPQPSPSANTLRWYSTCGDPVCRPDAPNSPNTCGDKTEGQSCSQAGESCDPGGNCGQQLVCAESDPKLQPGGCPISSRAHKEAVDYLGARQRQDMAQQLLNIRLAQYQYRVQEQRHGPQQPAQHLGFILEDLPSDSPAVLPNGQQVDVYGYVSMAVAALQEQAQEIQNLKQRIEELEKKAQP